MENKCVAFGNQPNEELKSSSIRRGEIYRLSGGGGGGSPREELTTTGVLELGVLRWRDLIDGGGVNGVRFVFPHPDGD